MDSVDWGTVSAIGALVAASFGYTARQLNRVEDKLTIRIDRLDGRIDRFETSVRADIGQLETSLRAEMDQLETSLRADIGQLETSLRAEMDQLEASVSADIGSVRADIGQLTERYIAHLERHRQN